MTHSKIIGLLERDACMPTTVIEKQCPHCGKYFELEQKPGVFQREHCSRSCAVRRTLKNRIGSDEWTKEENLELIALIGRFQRLQIIEGWNDIATEKGFPLRSLEGVKIQYDRLARKFGFSRKAILDNWTLRELGRQLDVPTDRVERWIELGLKHEKVGSYNRLTAISRKSFKAFAVAQPGQMWGIELNRLTKALGDRQLAKEIHAVADQPTCGRAIVVVRLDKAEVYKSARSAACTLKPEKWIAMKTSILRTCKKNTPMRNGMDFVQLDYPVYWVPMVYRDEFNQIAGRLLYEIHAELKPVHGYRKTTCAIVAARLAVQITLIIFRRRLKDAEEGKEFLGVDYWIKFWKLQFLNKFHKYVELQSSQMFPVLLSSIKSFTYKYIKNLLAEHGIYEHSRVNEFLDDYASSFIENGIKVFYNRSFLPRYYQPSDRIGTADLYAFIESMFWTRLEFGRDDQKIITRVGIARAKEYFYKFVLPLKSTYDLSGTGSNLETALATDRGESEHLLDSFVHYIIGLHYLTATQKEECELFIGLKLEDASNEEIAMAMNISPKRVREIESEIQVLARRYAEEEEVA